MLSERDTIRRIREAVANGRLQQPFRVANVTNMQAPLSDRHGCVLKFDFSGSGARMLVHPLPPTSRWRPYVAVGPVFQMIALADSP